MRARGDEAYQKFDFSTIVLHNLFMTPDIVSVGTLLALTALAAGLFWLVRVVSDKIDQIQPRDSPTTDALRAELLPLIDASTAMIDRHDERLTALTQAVAEGIDHVDRNEKRVRGIVQGAKRRFDAAGFDDAGVEAELDTLPERDARRGDQERLQPVQENVEADWTGTPWAAVPGIENA